MFIIVIKILIHNCNQIFCPIPIRNTLLLLLLLLLCKNTPNCTFSAKNELPMLKI